MSIFIDLENMTWNIAQFGSLLKSRERNKSNDSMTRLHILYSVPSTAVKKVALSYRIPIEVTLIEAILQEMLKMVEPFRSCG
jgi:hypothetical protein